jgi:hypothetical protein
LLIIDDIHQDDFLLNILVDYPLKMQKFYLKISKFNEQLKMLMVVVEHIPFVNHVLTVIEHN